MKLKLISILYLTLSGDSLITVSLIWSIIKYGGDARVLGVFLFINTIIPYLSQSVFRKYFSNVGDPIKSFVATRLVGAGISILLAATFYFYSNIEMLYISASVFTIINFFSNQYVEACFGHLVIKKVFSSNIAARIHQTSVQIAALLGASLAGFVLSFGGFQLILLVNVLTYFFGAWGFLVKIPKYLSSSNLVDKVSFSAVVKNSYKINNFNINYNFIYFMLLAILLYSFNFLLPFLVQVDKGWSSMVFGLIDACAAMGAFFSVFLSNKGRFNTVFSFVSKPLLIFSFASFFWVNEPMQAIMLGFLFGLSLNCLRIKIRESIFESTTSHDLALKFGKNITLINMGFRSVVPLILSWLFVKSSAAYLYFYVGIFVLLALLFLSFYFFWAKKNDFAYDHRG